MHCGGIKTAWSGRPSDSACRSSSARRTPCMLMRSYSSVMVVSSAVTRQSRAARNACNAIALSLPPLQQKSTFSGVRTSLMARCVFHANAKLAPERRISVHFRISLVREIVDAPVDAEAVRDVVRRREIEQRVARVGDLRAGSEIAVEPLAREVSGEVPVHPPEGRIQHDVSGIHRPPDQAATKNVV